MLSKSLYLIITLLFTLSLVISLELPESCKELGKTDIFIHIEDTDDLSDTQYNEVKEYIVDVAELFKEDLGDKVYFYADKVSRNTNSHDYYKASLNSNFDDLKTKVTSFSHVADDYVDGNFASLIDTFVMDGGNVRNGAEGVFLLIMTGDNAYANSVPFHHFLETKGFEQFVLSVGSKVTPNSQHFFASHPEKHHIIITYEFSELREKGTEMLEKMCAKAATTTPEKTITKPPIKHSFLRVKRDWET